MELILRITAKDGVCLESDCGDDCMFLDADTFDITGKCVLFNDVLRPNMKHGGVEGWTRCRKCHDTSSKGE